MNKPMYYNGERFSMSFNIGIGAEYYTDNGFLHLLFGIVLVELRAVYASKVPGMTYKDGGYVIPLSVGWDRATEAYGLLIDTLIDARFSDMFTRRRVQALVSDHE